MEQAPAFESIEKLKEHVVANYRLWHKNPDGAIGDFDSVAGIDRQLAKAKLDYCLIFYHSTQEEMYKHQPISSQTFESMLVDRTTGKGLVRHMNQYRWMTPQEEYELAKSQAPSA